MLDYTLYLYGIKTSLYVLTIFFFLPLHAQEDDFGDDTDLIEAEMGLEELLRETDGMEYRVDSTSPCYRTKDIDQFKFGIEMEMLTKHVRRKNGKQVNKRYKLYLNLENKVFASEYFFKTLPIDDKPAEEHVLSIVSSIVDSVEITLNTIDSSEQCQEFRLDKIKEYKHSALVVTGDS